MNIELRMTRPGIIRGRTVNKAGKPVAAVQVQATAIGFTETARSNPFAISDRNGNFEIRTVAPGHHRVHDSDMIDKSVYRDVDVKEGLTASVGDVVIPLKE